jgi:diaminohydroxyphosphoribosylaminopyrimidine deaminase / 5-amino-6-(5-phosphoribosylamino)uracil reductase
MPSDEDYLRQAIRLAMNGRGQVEPNPMVGCILVKNDRIIGQGYHQKFGGPHAEPNALASCTESPNGATAYVTLEPCCHTNKKTPPCVPQLINAKLARVVIGTLDPNKAVNGKGVHKLQKAGIKVDIASEPLRSEAMQLIAPFYQWEVRRRPYVTLKWAQTADAKVAGPHGSRLQITGTASNRLVHQLRARSRGLMVGINTILNDDPELTARDVDAQSQPKVFILDTNLRTPPSAKAIQLKLNRKVKIILGWPRYKQRFMQRIKSRERSLFPIGDHLHTGTTFVGFSRDKNGHVNLTKVLTGTSLKGDRGHHLLVEPGPTLAASFFRDNLCDRLWIFQSGRRINSDTAPAAASIPSNFIKTGELKIGEDQLTEYLNSTGSAFFSPTPSADFVLANTK